MVAQLRSAASDGLSSWVALLWLYVANCNGSRYRLIWSRVFLRIVATAVIAGREVPRMTHWDDVPR